MSAQNDPEGAPEESKEPKDPPKPMGKIVRVMTVLAYLSSVSMAAILLSIYYLCIWKSPVLSDLDAKVNHQQGESFDYQTGYMNNDSAPYPDTGGSSATINDSDIQLPPSSIGYPDEPGSSDAIDSTMTDPTTLSTAHHNGTTESSTVSTNDTSTIVKTTITV